MLGNIKYQPIPITVQFANEQIGIEVETDKLYAKLTGVFVNVVKEAVSSTFTKVSIGSEEIFPDGYEVRMLTSDLGVPVDGLYYELDEAAAGLKFKTTYRDSGLAASYPYTAVIYLRLENL
jgi:hypothetical protein